MNMLQTIEDLKNAQAAAHLEIEKDKEVTAKIEAFLLKHADRVKVWMQSNPGRKPPVVYLEKEGVVIWLNRDQRRKWSKRQKQQNSLKMRKVETPLSQSSIHFPKNDNLEKKVDQSNYEKGNDATKSP